LFIRLNDKPYPIRENSFEMWNSWVERDVIARIKENVNKHLSWFHLKIARNRNDRDRMENEELYTSLVYLEADCRVSAIAGSQRRSTSSNQQELPFR
jgi:hypothetical protein